MENQILKPGFTRREIVILENDDPGGVFEFSPVSKGPWFINVRPKNFPKQVLDICDLWVVDELPKRKTNHK